MRYFFLLLLLIGQHTRAQTVTAYRLFPANATANDNLKLVLTIFYGGCTRSFGYTVVRSGTALAITGCYPAVAITMPCGGSDTIQLGRLPAGAYTVTTTSHVAMTAADCPTSTALAAGQPNAPGFFTVGLAAAIRAPAPTWHFSPTVLPATASVLDLTDAPALPQVSIYDLSGREKAHYEASALINHNGHTQIPVPNLAPALYLLRLTDETGHVSTQRFVRQ